MTVPKCNPYRRKLPATWWLSNRFYQWYMLREGTALPALWFNVLLLYGLWSLKTGPERWAYFVYGLQHPIVMGLNLLALLAALLHSATWFQSLPRVQPVVILNRTIPNHWVIRTLWAVTLLVTLILLERVY